MFIYVAPFTDTNHKMLHKNKTQDQICKKDSFRMNKKQKQG